MSAKYRDQLLTAATHFKEGSITEFAYMEVVDAVIEDLADEAVFRRGFQMGEQVTQVTIERSLLAVFREIPSQALADSAWAACRGALPRCRKTPHTKGQRAPRKAVRAFNPDEMWDAARAAQKVQRKGRR